MKDNKGNKIPNIRVNQNVSFNPYRKKESTNEIVGGEKKLNPVSIY